MLGKEWNVMQLVELLVGRAYLKIRGNKIEISRCFEDSL